MPLRQRTTNLLKNIGTSTRTRLLTQLRLFPGASAISAIGAASDAPRESNSRKEQYADVVGTRAGVGTVTTTLPDGSQITQLTVSLSALRDALSSIGFSLPEDVQPGGHLQVSISGLTRQSAKPGEVSLLVTSGICETVEPLTSGPCVSEMKPVRKSSNTSRNRANSRISQAQ